MAAYSTGSLVLLLTICIATSVVSGQTCEERVATAQECFRLLNDEIVAATKHEILCVTETFLRIDQCGSEIILFCGSYQDDIQSYQSTTQTAFDDKCDILEQALPAPTPPPTTPPPPVKCENTPDAFAEVTKHMTRCMNMYKSLDQFTYASKLTQFGMCEAVQELLDCMLENQEFNDCSLFQDAIGTQLIPYVNFGHLLGCSLKLNQNSVYNRNEKSACNLWDWLACHDSLFTAIPDLGPISTNTDLYTLINFKAYELNSQLENGMKKCSDYKNVDWSSIRNCRGRMAEKCDMLDNPQSNTLWRNVLDALFEIKLQVYDNLYSMMKIEEICDSGCGNIIGKKAKINTCIATAGADLAEQVIKKSNSGASKTSECGKIAALKTCLRNEVIGNCDYLEEAVVVRLHNDNRWKLAFDLCKTDLEIQSSGRCVSEKAIAADILTKCSLQSQKLSILYPSYAESQFCYFMQVSTNCYAQYMSRCPSHERRFWAAEQTTVAAANQMISECDVNFLNVGELRVAPIDKTSCDMTRLVGCLGDLWDAFGVTIPADKRLPLAGFKALLALMWKDGDRADLKARCEKVRGLDYNKMETCVSGLGMTCDFPMMTVPDGDTYNQFLPNPFDIKQIKEFVRSTCEDHCVNTNVGEEVKNCLNYEQDLTVIQTYPHVIIYRAFTRLHDKAKCATIKTIKQCVEYRLDPSKCSLYRSDIVKNPAYLEAMDICENPPKSDDPVNVSGIATKVVVSSVVMVISTILVTFM